MGGDSWLQLDRDRSPGILFLEVPYKFSAPIMVQHCPGSFMASKQGKPGISSKSLKKPPSVSTALAPNYLSSQHRSHRQTLWAAGTWRQSRFLPAAGTWRRKWQGGPHLTSAFWPHPSQQDLSWSVRGSLLPWALCCAMQWIPTLNWGWELSVFRVLQVHMPTPDIVNYVAEGRVCGFCFGMSS